jgi:hypothetical protein
VLEFNAAAAVAVVMDDDDDCCSPLLKGIFLISSNLFSIMSLVEFVIFSCAVTAILLSVA